VSVGLSFVPAKPLSFPVYRGLSVSSVVQASDPLTGAPTGPPLTRVPLGTLVTVSTQVCVSTWCGVCVWGRARLGGCRYALRLPWGLLDRCGPDA
jgi:hypothetical protein